MFRESRLCVLHQTVDLLQQAGGFYERASVHSIVGSVSSVRKRGVEFFSKWASRESWF